MWESVENYLKVSELKDRYLYQICARNSDLGIWLKDNNSFLISRFKFDMNFLFEEIHWDVCTHFGTVKPIKEIEICPIKNAGRKRDWNEIGKESNKMREMVERKEIDEFHICMYENEIEILNYLNTKEKEIFGVNGT